MPQFGDSGMTKKQNLTLNEKSRLIIVEQSVVKVSNIFIGLKKTCLGVLERGDRDQDNETGLTEGGVIEMSTRVLSIRDALLHSRCSLSSLKILTRHAKFT